MLLRLPIWVTLVFLLLGTALLFLSPHLAEKRVADPKKAWLQLMAVFARLQSAHSALIQSPDDAAARQKFDRLHAECAMLLNDRPDTDWGTDSGYVAKIRKELAGMSAPAPNTVTLPASASGAELERLDELKKQGMMFDVEFQTFADKLKALATEKVCATLDAIAGYQLQCQQGKLTQADFHAALRGLMERLDSGEAGALRVTGEAPSEAAPRLAELPSIGRRQERPAPAPTRLRRFHGTSCQLLLKCNGRPDVCMAVFRVYPRTFPFKEPAGLPIC